MAADPIRNESGVPEPSTARVPLEPMLDDQSVEQLLAGFVQPDRTLPPAHNPRLNRTAESIGTALGSTVGRMRSGMSLVKGNLAETGMELTDKLSEKATDLSQKAAGIKESVRNQAQGFTSSLREQAGQFGDMVQDKTQQIVETTQASLEELRERARQRLIEARHRAAVLRQDHPLELIGAFAAAAFVIGIAMRVWRSNND